MEGDTLEDVVITDPTRRDLAVIRGLAAAEDAKQRKEAHYRDRWRVPSLFHLRWRRTVRFRCEQSVAGGLCSPCGAFEWAVGVES